MENLSYKELQAMAKERGLKAFGVSTAKLVESIKAYDEENFEEVAEKGTVEEVAEEESNEESVEEESEPTKEDIKEVEEVPEEVVEAPLMFNGIAVLDITNKIVNGKSYNEVRNIAGQSYLLTEEEYQAGISQ